MSGAHPDAVRVTIVGAIVDGILGIGKIGLGLIGNSQALVADGVHSLSDLVTDGVVLFAAKAGSKEADADHPYGHERIQTVATVFLGVSLILVAVGIAWSAVNRLLSGEELPVPATITLAVAGVSILSKEWIYHYTMRVARRLRSPLLKANAWHSRSDALSSIVVLVGLVGAMAGLTYLDAVAAVVVAAMIVRVGWSLGWDSVHELIDTGLDKVHLDNMRQALVNLEEVRDVHQLRTRRVGSQVFADVHVLVNPDVSVSEGHRLSEEAERVLGEELEDPTDITVHIDVEDDLAPPVEPLPLRRDVAPQIRSRWEKTVGIPLGRIQLHYLGNRINLEIHLAPDAHGEAAVPDEGIARFRQSYADDPVIGSIRVLQELP